MVIYVDRVSGNSHSQPSVRLNNKLSELCSCRRQCKSNSTVDDDDDCFSQENKTCRNIRVKSGERNPSSVTKEMICLLLCSDEMELQSYFGI